GRRPTGRLFQPLGTVSGGFGTIAPGGYELRQTCPFIFLVFDDQYFSLAHKSSRPAAIIEAPGVPCKLWDAPAGSYEAHAVILARRWYQCEIFRPRPHYF